MHCWSLISFKCVFPQIWCSSATIPSFPYPSSCSCSTPTFSAGSPIFFHPKVKARAVPEPTGSASTAQDEQEDFQVLTAIKSEYNDILILDTPKSRLLLLDSTRMLSLTPAFGFFLQVSCKIKSNQIPSNSTFTLIQIMYIAFLIRKRNGLVHIGYVEILFL